MASNHGESQARQGQIAAGGGAGRRPAQRRGQADESIARSAPLGLAAPLPPRGAMSRAVAGPSAAPGSRGLHAAERCAGRRSRRSRASVRAAISWTEDRPVRCYRLVRIRLNWR
jgi:hypothetical protein